MSKTKSERQYLSDAASLGCLICRSMGYGDTPAELHHPRSGQGMSQRSSNLDVIPLCAAHHRGIMHPAVPSIHLDKVKFERLFGSEAELVECTRREVAELRKNTIGRAA